MSEQNTPSGNPETQGSGGQKKAGGLLSGIMAILGALLIVALVFAGVFTYVVKGNLFGIGERFRAQFQTNPLLRLILPSVPAEFDPDAPENLAQDELLKRYAEYRSKVAALQQSLDAANTSLSAITAENLSRAAISADVEGTAVAQATERAELDAKKAELQAMTQKIAEAAAKGDTTGFRTWFEKIDKTAAASIYKDIMAAQSADTQAQRAARPFELMDRKKAADVMKELWSKDKQLLLSIVDANKAQTLAEILANMDATLAAEITRSLADFRKAKADTTLGKTDSSP